MTSLADFLVLAAAGTYFIGYLIINQVVLRLLVLLGTFFYIAYYATVADQPLWVAIWTSVALAASNVFGLGLLLAYRSRFSLPKDGAALYQTSAQFSELPPGDFRLLYKAAQRKLLDEDTVVATEGDLNDTLYYIVSGSAQAQKLGHDFALPPGIFVGEVAYLLHQPAAATTTISAGSEVLAWSYADLRERSQKSGRFKLALDAMISRDLARKVAKAVAPRAAA